MADETDRAVRFHAETFMFLSYVCAYMRFLPTGGVDSRLFFDDDPRLQGSMPHLRRGGINAIMLSFGVTPKDMFPGEAGVARARELIDNFLEGAAARSCDVRIVRGGEAIPPPSGDDRLAIAFHLIGAWVGDDLSLLSDYRDIGVRSIHPPFDCADPAAGNVESDGGRLTARGRTVVREIHNQGMLVDVSHASDESFWEIMDLVDGPVIASHSNCRSLCDVSRNLTDEQVEAIGEKDGVIGIHFASGFIEKDFDRRFRATGFYEVLREWEDALRAECPDPHVYLSRRLDLDAWDETELYAMQSSVQPPSISKLVDHIDRIVELAGMDHVGIGTDYDNGSNPEGLSRAGDLPNLTSALMARGYTDEDLRKLWGENFMRVFGRAT